MFNQHFSKSIEPDELAALNQQWGAAPLRLIQLEGDDPFLTGEHQLLTSDGRRGEICYVMHRGAPESGLLLHIKTYYPEGAYRLPTGGIHVGEQVFETLGREIYEETGLTVGVTPQDVRVERFLGVLHYDFLHRRIGRAAFATYHFLVQMPDHAELQPQDPEESIGGWEWRRPRELYAVADTLDAVYLRSSIWGSWGHFRALSHRFVAEMMG
ncbi:MAG: NUDIX hydrolase [Anaerolineales bacterium]|nr:NUDIX hydrolase [Anaerolineales bacterium]